MNYLKEIFKFYNGKYFIQSYLVSGVLAFFYLVYRDASRALFSVECLPEMLFIIFSTLLYPFAKASYLYTKELLLPDDMVIVSYLALIYFAKVFMAMLIYTFAIPLGLINVAIIVVKYRKKKKIDESIQWFE